MSAESHSEAQLLEQAKQLQDVGDERSAAGLFGQILQANPRHPVALFRMGCLLYSHGNIQQAAQLLRASVEVNPREPECHHALATAYFDLGQEAAAEACLREAIRLSGRPHFHFSLGNLLRRQGLNGEALEEFERAAQLGADAVEVGLSMGRVHLAAGNPEEGRERFHLILVDDPLHAGALRSMRQSLLADQRGEEAALYLDRALAAIPQSDADGLRDFGGVLQDVEDWAGAAVSYRRALDADPESAATWFALGCAETSRVEYAEAVPCFERALEIRPEWWKARHNLGRALFELGRVEEAAACLRICIARGTPEDAALSRLTLAALIPGVPAADNEAVLSVRRAWAESLPPPVAVRQVRPPAAGVPLRIGYLSSFFHRDNWMKPVWGLINQHDRETVELHLFSDVEREEIRHGYRPDHRDKYYDTRQLSNEALAGLIASSGVQVLIDLNGYSNLNRLPLFQKKIAPVTIGWFNFYATSGLAGFDYLIGDAEVIPVCETRLPDDPPPPQEPATVIPFGANSSEAQRDRPGDPPQTQEPEAPIPFCASSSEAQRDRPGDPPQTQEPEAPIPFCASSSEECFYCERILRVDGGSYLTFNVDYPVPPVASGPSQGPVTFGSLCSLYKITPEVIAAWSRILLGVPESGLVLKNASLQSEATRRSLRQRFADCGVSPERLELEGPSGHFAFLQTYDRIDLALDTFPYNGGTSTTEAIWQGVPVLTFAGDRWASRTSASILRAAGLGEYVAADCESFIALAVDLAHQPRAERRARRSGMRERIRKSAVCDTRAFARQMERLYGEALASAIGK
jgi:predicted O-linked N-acetylglucosamine transferase (SPINDLY family)